MNRSKNENKKVKENCLSINEKEKKNMYMKAQWKDRRKIDWNKYLLKNLKYLIGLCFSHFHR